MIRITVEILPGGSEQHARARVMGTATLCNLRGARSASHADYELKVFSPKGRCWNKTILRRFPRARLTVWPLLAGALYNLFVHRTSLSEREYGKR